MEGGGGYLRGGGGNGMSCYIEKKLESIFYKGGEGNEDM